MMARRDHQNLERLVDFPRDESGAQAIEALLIFTAIGVPCFVATLLLHQVFDEYLRVTTLLITSPFF